MSLMSSIRAVFTLGRGVLQGLPRATADRDPIELFGEWFRGAKDSGILLPEAATLVTCSKDAVPSGRMILLKDYSDRGFVFYTNYESRKARELEENPRAGLVFYWAVLERQVRIEGGVSRVSRPESEAYFHSRPRGSQIGAWASKQSAKLSDGKRLRDRYRDFSTRFRREKVPLPEFWGGYRITPRRIEFWQGRADRLHDRLCFERADDGWTVSYLYP